MDNNNTIVIIIIIALVILISGCFFIIKNSSSQYREKFTDKINESLTESIKQLIEQRLKQIGATGALVRITVGDNNIVNTIEKYIKIYTLNLAKNTQTNTQCIIELYILNVINDIPIVVYNEYQVIMYVFDKDIIYDYLNKSMKPDITKYMQNPNAINMRFIYKNTNIPIKIEALYCKE